MALILIIEDEDNLREEVIEWLGFEGFEAIGAHNGREGIVMALEHHPDLIISDMMMPEMDGHRVLLEVRTHPELALTPLIFLSARADRQHIRRAMELGADNYITKPFTIEELLHAINTALEKRRAPADASAADGSLQERLKITLPGELRSPLITIMGLSELLYQDASAAPPDVIRYTTEKIAEQGKMLLHRVENYMLYIRIEALAHDLQAVEQLRQVSCTNTTSLIKLTCKEVSDVYRRMPDLFIRVEDSRLQISEEHLQKIVSEIVDNAFRYSPPASEVRVTGVVEAAGYHLTFSNRGSGFLPDTPPRIAASGCKIADSLVKLYGGSMTIDGSVETGTQQVHIILPLA